MQPENAAEMFAPDVTSSAKKSRLETIAFRSFLATIVLAPLAFWPSAYISLDLVKIVVIAIGTIISAISLILIARNGGKSPSFPFCHSIPCHSTVFSQLVWTERQKQIPRRKAIPQRGIVFSLGMTATGT